jgi:hypothetical protein
MWHEESVGIMNVRADFPKHRRSVDWFTLPWLNKPMRLRNRAMKASRWLKTFIGYPVKVLLCALLVSCVQRSNVGDVVTGVHRDANGDLMVKRCELESKTTYVFIPVGVDLEKQNCKEVKP